MSTLLVMPFENHSKVVGADWISEACPEVLSQRMSLPGVYVISRDDRMFAFDRAGVPPAARPSRATIFRVAEQMGADFAVLGSYEVSDSTFQVTAQLLDVKGLRLHPEIQSKGPLADFVALQTAVAWQLLQAMPHPPQVTQQEFMKVSDPIRLDAFESYIRGVVATGRQQKIHYFKDAVRLNPGYTAAALQLGRVYYEGHDYEQAAVWLAKVPKDDPSAGEATFLLGMSDYNRGNLDRAYVAFTSLAARLPLTEVYNNLGVVDARRGRKSAAVEYFSKAVTADPSDPDYRFNYALALFKNGDSAGAARQLREELQHRPTDAEARSLLDMINRGVTAPSSATTSGPAAQPGQPRIPIERIKRNYDETSYRQLQMEINNLKQQRLPK
ncbi:MAG TPA: tetratricopeptide repeat protein [Candidatus Eisenbacteria bacterium]|nr:tetratricopeptide repeat protein [Candidatus Eisenbacteria bacterium]